MKISLLLAAAMASVTHAETSEHKATGPSKSSKRGKNSKKGKYPFKDETTCSDFEGRWEAIDGEDYSNLSISIVCDGDTATIRYVDDKWLAPTCGDLGGPGGFVANYTLNADDSSIGRDGNFTLTCQDLTEETKDFKENQFVLKDNGSLQRFDFYNFWKVSNGQCH